MLRELSTIGIGFSIIFMLAVGSNINCYYDNEEDLYPDNSCDTVNVSYSAVIQPILETACYACHDEANNFGGITLEGYEALIPFVQSGGLLGTIKREAGWSPMPKNQGPLAECNITKIEAWINQGAQDN